MYDETGRLVEKSGTVDFEEWQRLSDVETPWGGRDSPILATAVESELERELSRSLLRAGERPERRQLETGETLVRQGDEGREMFLLLDGVLEADVDGRIVARLGPGAVLGERALIEGGARTSTLRAATPVRVAVVSPDAVDEAALPELARSHRAEEGGSS